MRPVFLIVALAIAGTIVAGTVVTWPDGSAHSEAQLLAGAQIPTPVLATLKRSCSDCHSDATHYPWYSYVFPVSWLISHDVTRGRKHLNLSRWNEYSSIRKQRCLSEIANQVQDGGMPLPKYTLIHRDARLSRTEVEAIFNWTQQERARIIATTVPR